VLTPRAIPQSGVNCERLLVSDDATEAKLLRQILRYRHDPLGFVQFAFPGQEGHRAREPHGSFRLAGEGTQRHRRQRLRGGQQKIRRATASGKGIGKSALVAWESLWGLCTCRNTRIRLTAGTDGQLKTTTMPELAKWFQMLICAHWFKFTATSVYVNDPCPRSRSSGGSTRSPGTRTTPRRSPACTTRAAASCTSSTRRRRSPTASGTPRKASSPTPTPR